MSVEDDFERLATDLANFLDADDEEQLAYERELRGRMSEDMLERMQRAGLGDAERAALESGAQRDELRSSLGSWRDSFVYANTALFLGGEPFRPAGLSEPAHVEAQARLDARQRDVERLARFVYDVLAMPCMNTCCAGVLGELERDGAVPQVLLAPVRECLKIHPLDWERISEAIAANTGTWPTEPPNAYRFHGIPVEANLGAPPGEIVWCKPDGSIHAINISGASALDELIAGLATSRRTTDLSHDFPTDDSDGNGTRSESEEIQ